MTSSSTSTCLTWDKAMWTCFTMSCWEIPRRLFHWFTHQSWEKPASNGEFINNRETWSRRQTTDEPHPHRSHIYQRPGKQSPICAAWENAVFDSRAFPKQEGTIYVNSKIKMIGDGRGIVYILERSRMHSWRFEELALTRGGQNLRGHRWIKNFGQVSFFDKITFIKDQ